MSRCCVLIGISPPSEDLWEKDYIMDRIHLVEKQQNDDSTWGDYTDDEEEGGDQKDEDQDQEDEKPVLRKIQWSREKYSLAPDEERQNMMTLLLQAYYTEGDLTSQDIVRAVQAELNSYTSSSSSPENNESSSNNKYFVEEWSSTPSPLPLCPISGGYDKNIDKTINPSNDNNDSNDWEEKAGLILQEYGIVLQLNLLSSPEIINELRSIIDDAIMSTESSIRKHHPNIKIGQDSFVFKEIASRNLERFDMRLNDNKNVIEFVDTYIRNHHQVKALLKRVLLSQGNDPTDNDDALLNDSIDYDVSIVYSRPGAINQEWHSDGKHQFPEEWGWEDNGWKHNKFASTCYAYCLFIPLIDLNTDVGYTQFWPKSHLYSKLIGFGQVAELTSSTYDGITHAGDAIWYDYRLLHRGIHNSPSSNTLRPVLQIIFKKKWYVERANYAGKSIIPEEDEEEEDGMK